MAARAIWRGTISFGMVSIPVKLFTATDSQDISFKQLHAADNSPIRLVRRCAADGDLSQDEIVKGYESRRTGTSSSPIRTSTNPAAQQATESN